MDTKITLEKDLIAAMRSQDDLRKRTLRMVLSAVKLAEIEKGSQLDELAMVGILHKEIKSRKESMEDAQKANRPDLVAAAQAEIAILETYLPQPLSEHELEDIAKQAIAEVGATTIREMGQVMKILIPRLQGRVTGDQASQVVRKLLE